MLICGGRGLYLDCNGGKKGEARFGFQLEERGRQEETRKNGQQKRLGERNKTQLCELAFAPQLNANGFLDMTDQRRGIPIKCVALGTWILR